MQTMKIKIPTGYIIIEAKGSEDNYPGCNVCFSKDGETVNTFDEIACVEYDTTADDGSITVATYKPEEDDPSHIINYQTGKDKI